MNAPKRVSLREVEQKFQALRSRDEIKRRYGVFTQKMLETLLDKKLSPIQEKSNQTDERLEKIEKRLDWIMEKIDWLVGKQAAHDDEHTLITDKIAEHSDRLEIVEHKLGIQSV